MNAVARAAAARVQSTVRSQFFGDTRALQRTRACWQRPRRHSDSAACPPCEIACPKTDRVCARTTPSN
uniref:Uncharacterized protein n=1 Tax=Trichogramma kaykai TaxID=54128 RepID=A0ABD2XC16_9HYME